MDTLIQDIRYGFRTLLKTPGFTAIAVLSLALGIGANTAIFSIVNALMLRSLPVRDPNSLALIGHDRMIGIMGGIPGRSLDLIPPDILRSGKSMFVNVTGPDYLSTTGVPLLAGRFFTLHDTATSGKVAVINETAAREIFGGTSAIGKRMSMGAPEHGHDVEIIGVIKDVKTESVTEGPHWAVYQPYAQRNDFVGNLLVRTDHVSAPLIAAVRRAVAEVAPDLPITEVLTLRTMVDRSLIRQRLVAELSGFFGVLALLLAAIGLYGILSYSVVRRTPEIGVRMALGAQTARVLWMVLRETLLLVGLGVAIGLPVALASSRLVASMLYGLQPNDAFTLLAGTATLLTIGAFAGWLPARRAARVDPMIALRYE